MRDGEPRTRQGRAPFTNNRKEHRSGKEDKGELARAHTYLFSHARAALRHT
jgi:hypothetical protein